MKTFYTIILLFAGVSSFSQITPEEEAKKIIVEFFDAFHRQDSIALKNLAHPSVRMQSIGNNKEGETRLTGNAYADFVKSITTIPSTTQIEEIIHSYEVSVNGPLANIITPYTFLVNGKLSHCGVNAFTLVKEMEDWKIVHIIDTRSNENCLPLP